MGFRFTCHDQLNSLYAFQSTPVLDTIGWLKDIFYPLEGIMRNIWIENFKRLNKFLMPICFFGCTYSLKHKNSKVFTTDIIQISVTQYQMTLKI